MVCRTQMRCKALREREGVGEREWYIEGREEHIEKILVSLLLGIHMCIRVED